MLNVIVIDCSHRDRPSLSFQASEVISDSRGTTILTATTNDHRAYHPVSSIFDLLRDIRQGFDIFLSHDFFLSHDWVVKVHG